MLRQRKVRRSGHCQNAPQLLRYSTRQTKFIVCWSLLSLVSEPKFSSLKYPAKHQELKNSDKRLQRLLHSVNQSLSSLMIRKRRKFKILSTRQIKKTNLRKKRRMKLSKSSKIKLKKLINISR